MKAAITGALALGLCASTSGAEVTGGSLSLDHVVGGSRNATQIEGSLVYALGNGMMVQGDVGAGRNSAVAGHIGYWGAHLGYQLPTGTTIGALASFENWSGGRHMVDLGIEARHDFGQNGGQPIAIEGYLVRNKEVSAPFAFTGFGLSAAYGITPTGSLTAGVFSSGGDLERTRVSIGLNYLLADQVNVGLEAAHTNRPGSNDTSVGINVGFKFGGGGLFESRNTSSFLPGE